MCDVSDIIVISPYVLEGLRYEPALDAWHPVSAGKPLYIGIW